MDELELLAVPYPEALDERKMGSSQETEIYAR